MLGRDLRTFRGQAIACRRLPRAVPSRRIGSLDLKLPMDITTPGA